MRTVPPQVGPWRYSGRTVGQAVNIGTGREISIGDLVELLNKITGNDAEIVIDAERVRPGASEVERLVCDNTRARELADWEPRHTLEEGLQITSEWVADNLELFEPARYAR